MKPKGNFECLWDYEPFTRHLLSIVFDEAHCISTWGSFRPDYKHLSRLHYLLTNCHHVQYCLLSATLSPPILRDVYETLGMDSSNTKEFLRPNDRPNVFLAVREMQHPASSFKDLEFLAPMINGRRRLTAKKFIIFFDSIKEAEACCSMEREARRTVEVNVVVSSRLKRWRCPGSQGERRQLPDLVPTFPRIAHGATMSS